MHNRHFIISMTIHGEKSPAFSGITLELPAITVDYTDAIVAASRKRYGTHRKIVEAAVGSQYQSSPSSSSPTKRVKPLFIPLSLLTQTKKAEPITLPAATVVTKNEQLDGIIFTRDYTAPASSATKTPPAHDSPLPTKTPGQTATNTPDTQNKPATTAKRRRRRRKSKARATVQAAEPPGTAK